MSSPGVGSSTNEVTRPQMAIREVRAAAGKDVPKVDIRTTTPTSARLSTPSIVATAQAEKTEKAAERAVSWVGTTGDAHTFYR